MSIKKRKNKLHIISFDGLSKVDMDFLNTLENFKEFLKEGSYSFEVNSIYPSLTYAAHTSITTGNYPKKHGIIHNTFLQPHRKSPDWHWYAKDIKTDTFQNLATKEGMNVLSIMWPVSAGAKIKYNMPEIFANRPWKKQMLVSMCNGSAMYQYKMNKLYGHLRNGHKEPELDNFIHNAYLHSLKNYKTDITMVHYIDLDSQRHDYGFNSKEAYEALKRHDKRLGEIIRTIKSEGEWEDTTLVVLGDHSSSDVHTNIFINSIFNKYNLLELNDKGTAKDYKVIAQSCGGSCYIYRKDENIDLTFLKDIIDKEVGEYIENIYTGNEAGDMGADPNCTFMLEGKKGYAFNNMAINESILSNEKTKRIMPYAHVNDHGYNPNHLDNYETVFMVKGPKIKKDFNIGKMNLIDEGPTFAEILGLKLNKVDGRVLKEIFR